MFSSIKVQHKPDPLNEGGGVLPSVTATLATENSNVLSTHFRGKTPVCQVFVFPEFQSGKGKPLLFGEQQTEADAIKVVAAALMGLLSRHYADTAAGRVKMLGESAIRNCKQGRNAYDALDWGVAERRLAIAAQGSEIASQVLSDLPGDQVLLTWGMERFLKLDKAVRAEFIAASAEFPLIGKLAAAPQLAAITDTLFGDVIGSTVAPEGEKPPPISIFARDALPACMALWFGKQLDLVCVADAEHANSWHLEQYTTVKTFAIIVAEDKSALSAAVDGSYALALTQPDGRVALSLSSTPEPLHALRQSATNTHQPPMEPGPYVDGDGRPWYPCAEVTDMGSLKSFMALGGERLDIGLVKLEFWLEGLLDGIAGADGLAESPGRRVISDFTIEELSKSFTEALNLVGSGRTITFRLVDPIDPERGDKPSVAMNRRDEFDETTLRALARAALTTGKRVGVMIPHFSSEEKLLTVQKVIKEEGAEYLVGISLMIESQEGIEETRKILEKGVPIGAMAIGLSDLCSDCTGIARDKLPEAPTQEVIQALHAIASISTKHKIPVTACGALTERTEFVKRLGDGGFHRVAFPWGAFNKGVEVIRDYKSPPNTAPTGSIIRPPLGSHTPRKLPH